MTQTMRAARVVEHHKPYELKDVPVPQPKGHDLLVKLHAAGFCHTDMMVQDADPSLPSGSLPLTGSHEPAGVVEAVGDAVTGFAKGDRVAATAFKDPCGQCADCRSGDTRFCDNADIVGLSVDGAFATYCLVDSRSAAKVPDALSFAQAAPMTCAGATIWGAIQRCELSKGQTLGIVGLGALGHIGVQLAAALGLRCVGIDTKQAAIDAVKRAKNAPELALNAKDGKDGILRAIKDKLGVDGLDAVIDATGVSKGHELCFDIVKKHGLFVLVGQPPDPLSIDFFTLIFRDITVKGSLLATQKQLQELLDFVGALGIVVDVREYKLDDVNKAREDAEEGSKTGKAVVVF